MAQQPVMSVQEIEAFLDREFPQLHYGGRVIHVEDVGPQSARLRMDTDERHLRPGGTLSGPAMMGLADLALYVVTLAHIGPVALAVTTNLSFNFLRKPRPGALWAEARLLKLGRRLAVGEVGLQGEGGVDLVCHCTGTYSIPDAKRRGIQIPFHLSGCAEWNFSCALFSKTLDRGERLAYIVATRRRLSRRLVVSEH